MINKKYMKGEIYASVHYLGVVKGYLYGISEQVGNEQAYGLSTDVEIVMTLLEGLLTHIEGATDGCKET